MYDVSKLFYAHQKEEVGLVEICGVHVATCLLPEHLQHLHQAHKAACCVGLGRKKKGLDQGSIFSGLRTYHRPYWRMRHRIKFVILQLVIRTDVDICTFVLCAVTVFRRGED